MKTPRWVASLALPHLFALLAVHRTALALPMWNPNEITNAINHATASASAAESVEPFSLQQGVAHLDSSLHPLGHYDSPQGVDGHYGYGAYHQPVVYNFQPSGDGQYGYGAHDQPVPYNFQQGVDGQYGHPDHSLFVPVQSEYQLGADTQHDRAALHGSAASSHENEDSTQQPPQFTPRFGFQLSDFSPPASTPRPPDHHNSWEGAFQQAEGSSRPRRRGKARGKAPSTSSGRTADNSRNQERLDISSLGEFKPGKPRNQERLDASSLGEFRPRAPWSYVKKIGNPKLLEAVRGAVVTRLNELEGKLRSGPPEWQGSRSFKEDDIKIMPPPSGARPSSYAYGFETFDTNNVAPHLFGDIPVHGYDVRITEWYKPPDELKITGMRLYKIFAREVFKPRPDERNMYFLGNIYIPEEWTNPVQQLLNGKLVWVPFDRASNYKPATRTRSSKLSRYDKK